MLNINCQNKRGVLAELIGMTLGDGSVGNYAKYRKIGSKYKKDPNAPPRCQYVRIYCNMKEDQYAQEIYKVLCDVFDKKPCWRYRPKINELYVEISQKNLNNLLGIPAGDKIKNKVRIAPWIFLNKIYLRNCLRGIFDTDGCCYLTGKKYQIIDFTSKNIGLLDDIFNALNFLNYHPYRMVDRVELGRQQEVLRFFREVKPKNQKHYRHQNAAVANVVTARL